MKYNPDTHNRRSIRLKGYDYSQAGAYFVTVCIKERHCLFGKISEGNITLSEIGAVARDLWLRIPEHFGNVRLDEFVVMPNHLHGIIIIDNNNDVGVQYPDNDVRVQYIEPLPNQFQKIIPKSIGSIIRSYKAAVTRQCNRNNKEHFRWQRNYYDHVIRNDESLSRIRDYIVQNLSKWDDDIENPDK